MTEIIPGHKDAVCQLQSQQKNGTLETREFSPLQSAFLTERCRKALFRCYLQKESIKLGLLAQAQMI